MNIRYLNQHKRILHCMLILKPSTRKIEQKRIKNRKTMERACCKYKVLTSPY